MGKKKLVAKNCKICNKKFISYITNHKKYCSRSCFQKTRQKNIIFKYCKICKKKFRSIPQHNRKYCSNSCLQKFYKKQQISKYCKMCNKKFVSYISSNRKYCSKSCLHKSYKRKWVFKNCKTCGKIFASYLSSKRKYCSNECHQRMKFIHNPKMKNKISKSLMGKMCGEKNPNFKPKIILHCKYCKHKFLAFPYSKETRKFCSRKCKDIWQKEALKGIHNPNWKEIKKINPGCRRAIRKKILKKHCDFGKCKAKDHLQIHHKDGECNNNDPKNLRTLCKNHHALIHLKLGQICTARFILNNPH